MSFRKTNLLIFAILVWLTSPSFIYALPEGESVVSGSATFDRSAPNTLNVNTPSDKLIVDYNSFNIAQQEAVNFAQPSSSAIALNRVVGIDPSSILGALNANGRIFIVNPNGVLFGPNSRVDVAALVASTLNISNEDFLNGNYNFYKVEGKNGYIINQGYIASQPGGYICLLSQAVENRGTIQAELGTVVLASGEKMTLALDDLNQISVVIAEPVKEAVFGSDGEKIDSAIKNSGTISANGGKVILTAKVLKDVFDYAINNTGIIEAKSVVNHNGVIELVATGAPIVNSGSLIAGEVKVNTDSDFINIGNIITDGNQELPDGGKVTIEAETVLHQGKISANAFERGIAGEIILISQSLTTLDTNSTTEARALGLAGNGGRILIDSKGGNTVVNKNAVIDVSAGAISGNAGFIEVSAFDQLGFYGVLNGRAPPGYKIGTAILDPEQSDISGTFDVNTTIFNKADIRIAGDIILVGNIVFNIFSDHKSKTPNDWHNKTGGITYKSGAELSVISGASAILNLKAAGDGKIKGIGTSQQQPIKTNVAKLSAEINPSSSGDIYISQGATPLTLTSLTTPNGTISVTAADSIHDGNGSLNNITATNLILSAATGIGSADNPLETQVSYLQATNTTSGDINITNTGDLIITSLANPARSINLTASGTITQSGAITAGTLIITTKKDGGADITLDSVNNDVDILALYSYKADGTTVAGGNLTFTDRNDIKITEIKTTGNITLTATNTSLTGTLTLDSSSVLKINGNLNVSSADANLNASAGTIDLDGNLVLSAGPLTAPSGNFYIGGNFNHTGGTFNANLGTVIFDGTSLQEITSGSLSFNAITIANASSAGVYFKDALIATTLTDITASTKLTFKASVNHNITNLYLDGQAATTRITLVSDTPATQFNLTGLNGTVNAAYVDVKDSNVANLIVATGSNKDSGNNINWYLVDHFIVRTQSDGSSTNMNAGDSLELKITAIDGSGGISTSFSGSNKTLTFSGPADAPNGSHPTVEEVKIGLPVSSVTFTNGVANASPGTALTFIPKKAESSSIDVSDGIKSSTDDIAYRLDLVVNPASANKLNFVQQPTNTIAGATITPSPTVAVRDIWNNLCTNDNITTVTIAIGTNPGSGTLSGRLTQIIFSGIATFNDLSINNPGIGYSLLAFSPGLIGAVSNSFNVNVNVATTSSIASQLSNAMVFRPLPPTSEQLGGYQFNPFIPMGPVYFYHPLTPIDMSAFEAFILEDGAYEFIDGKINIIGHKGLSDFLFLRR